MKFNIKDYLGDRAFYSKLVKIALPISLQGLITIGVNMMDTIMVGQLGETAISASSLANQFINVFHIFCMGMGMGASVLTSRFWGMQDVPALKKAITIMFRLCLVLGSLFTIATIITPGGIMKIYTSSPDVIAEGINYFKWSIPTYLLMGFSLTTTIVLRSVGQVKLPLYCSIIAFFINIGANYTFIFGKFGAPEMGVAGAALGTLISRLFEFCFICGYFIIFEKKICYRLKDLFGKCKDMVREYVRISIPVLISDGMLALGNNSVAMIVGRLGDSFVSANAIAAVLMQFSTVFISGLSNGSAIMTGHTLGEGDVERARKQGWTFLGFGVLVGAVACCIILGLSGPVIGMYKISAETVAITKQLIASLACIVFFQTSNSILTKGVLRGGGDTKFLMVADILFLWIASIPLGYVVGIVLGWSPFLTYLALKIDQIIKAIWCVFRLKSGKWIKRIG